MSNKIIFTILFLFIVFSFANVVFADAAQEIIDRANANRAKVDIACGNYKYPWCEIKELGGSEGLIGKFYTYALAVVGVAALGAIIYGGILHTVSSGNASQQTEARAWIWGAVMGVMLLLGAYLLLNTVNPELVKLTDPSGLIEKKKIKEETGSNCSVNSDCDQSAGFFCASTGEKNSGGFQIYKCKKTINTTTNKTICSGNSSYYNKSIECDLNTQKCFTEADGRPFCTPK